MSSDGQRQEVNFSKETLVGASWMAGTKAALFFVYFVISVLLVRRLGVEDYGIYSLCKSLAEYLIPICGLGLNTALLRFIPELAVATNRAGMIRLLRQSVMIQAFASLCVLALLTLFSEQLASVFKLSEAQLFFLTGLLVVAHLGKNFFNDTFTALFQVKKVALLSAIQAFLWLVFLLKAPLELGAPAVALWVLILSLSVTACFGLVFVVRYFYHLNWRSPPRGVGRARTLALSLPAAANTVMRMLMQKYTEIFFLGYYTAPAVVGVYELGYTAPFLALGLIPNAVQGLFVSAFSQAYVQDRNALPRLIKTFYKVLMLLVVPLAVFGFFFAPVAVVLIYGEPMAAAGKVASWFSLIHLLPMVSMPLSMAIVAKEKVVYTLPLLLLQIAVNLGLDFLLIPSYGLEGALCAVPLTFALTIPFRLRVTSRLVGGIYFPCLFLIKLATVCFVVAASLSPLSPYLGWVTLPALGGVYALACLLLLRTFKVMDLNDVKEVKALNISRFSALVDVIVSKDDGKEK